jgi:hypothetical protein
MNAKTIIFAGLLFVSVTIAQASTDTIGPHGINSAGLLTVPGEPLDGSGITIGQIEPGRPGKQNDPDTVAYNNFVNPLKVFDESGIVSKDILGPDAGSGLHAEWMASIMISTDTTPVPADANGMHFAPTGVATGARLLSNAAEVVDSTDDFTAQNRYAVSSQQIVTYAKDNFTDPQQIRAINMSFGWSLGNTHVYDGNSTLTEYVDWSAKNDDILYVVAGNELDDNNNPLIGIPADNFNGMTIASSKKDANGDYSVVSSRNDYSGTISGDRTWISLMAPGENIDVDNPAPDGRENRPLGGTSEAAAMVTATVALLQQHAEQQHAAGGIGANFSTTDYRHPEVMKAVLMNSANKLIDNHMIPAGGNLVPQGGLLGMTRTVVDQNGNNWLQSTAYNNPSQPLDPQMGTGELDAHRAYTQLNAGEFHSFQVSNEPEVPVMGWDYGTTRPALPNGDHPPNIYRFNQALVAGSFVSITLAFDRTVTFANDQNSNGKFDFGDTFNASTDMDHPGEDQLSDLDLYLLPKGATSKGQAVASSEAFGTVDHIFFQIPFDMGGQYEFWVSQFNANIDPEHYAVAWWADGTGTLTSGAGDINRDDHIDAKDINAMIQALTNESAYAQADGLTADQLALIGDVNGDGQFTNADIQSLIALLESGGGSTSVPEPASLVLLAIGGVALLRRNTMLRFSSMRC